MKRVSAFVLLSACTIALSSCFTPLSKRYTIPLHEGFFTSGDIDSPIDFLGNVTKVELTLAPITNETYESMSFDAVRDYSGDAYYEINLLIFGGEELFNFEYEYIGTNNNQPDSYVFRSEYLSHQVHAYLIVNPNGENKETLEYFEFTFNIYGATDIFYFTTDLHEESQTWLRRCAINPPLIISKRVLTYHIFDYCWHHL